MCLCVCADCGEESGIGISWIQQKYIHVYVQYLPSHIFALLSIVVKFSLIHLILGQIPYICTIDFHALSLISLHRLCLIDFVVLQLT